MAQKILKTFRTFYTSTPSIKETTCQSPSIFQRFHGCHRLVGVVIPEEQIEAVVPHMATTVPQVRNSEWRLGPQGGRALKEEHLHFVQVLVCEQLSAPCCKFNKATVLNVLWACRHGHLVDDGHRLFSALTQDYSIEPEIVNYNCVVDLLGRAGHLEEAKLFISDMPIEPDAVTWKALLGACRTYGNVELGEVAAKGVFNSEPNDTAAYVLFSNIYAAAGEWEKRESVRTMMQKRGVRKEAGCSWIGVDKKIHEFGAGDISHTEAKAIYTELNKLTEKLKAEGYIPDTRLVLHDVNEEDKELAL